MHALLKRPRRMLPIAAAILPLAAFAPSAQADVYKWEYIDPADHGQGKRASATTTPGGAGVNAQPGAYLRRRDLTMAYLVGADLTSADATEAILTDADLSRSNLTNASLSGAKVGGADFTDAVVAGANFGGTGVTLAQLSSTASYQARTLRGIDLRFNEFAPGANFAGQDLTQSVFARAGLREARFTDSNLSDANFSMAALIGADFRGASLANAALTWTNLTNANFASQDLRTTNFSWATLTNADFTNAEVGGANFAVYFDGFGGQVGTGITPSQLSTTASYQARDLSGVNLHGNYLAGADLVGQKLVAANFSSANIAGADLSGANLTDAKFSGATLTDARLDGADVTRANFSRYYLDSYRFATGITREQLYSTASYQAHDLSGVNLSYNNLVDGDFVGQDLTDASFYQARVSNGDFRRAKLTNVTFNSAYLPGANFSGQQLVQATFYVATLDGASFQGADLTDADFTAASLGGADFAGAEVRGAVFDSTVDGGFTAAQLYSTASYQAHALNGIQLSDNDLRGWNFSNQDLSDVGFVHSWLSDADFTNAKLSRAKLSSATYYGFAAAQLYSTASYRVGDLAEFDLAGNDLAGWSFAGQNLTHASFQASNLTDSSFRRANLLHADFQGATLTGADFSGADVRGANFYQLRVSVPSPGTIVVAGPPFHLFGTGISLEQLVSTSSYRDRDIRGVWGLLDPSIAETHNLILPDGHVHRLDLHAGDAVTIRDFNDSAAPIPITIDEAFAMDTGSIVRMVFDAGAWDSTISFSPGIPVTLGGTLELAFADDATPASHVGRPVKLFNWTGTNPTGAFTVSSLYAWDLSRLYATGEVTLLAVPEPGSLCVLAVFVPAVVFMRRRSPLPRRIRRLAAALSLLATVSAAHADIYQWEYVDPADPTQGKRPGATLAPEGADLDALPRAILTGRNLTRAYLVGADLSGADLGAGAGPIFRRSAILNDADLSHGILANTNFRGATLTGADFTGAVIGGAIFDVDLFHKLGTGDFPGARTYVIGGGISPAQLYSTASYQSHDLVGVGFSLNKLAGVNFANQRIADASFQGADLTDADFTDADVRGADFGKPFAYTGNILDIRLVGTGISVEQLSSTANYRAHDLSGIDFSFNNLSGANFAGQNLAHTNFFGAWVGGAEFTDAEVRGVAFDRFVHEQTGTPGRPLISGSGITSAQLYVTASYRQRDIRGVSGIVADIGSPTLDAPNLIHPNGDIQGVDLDAGGSLVLRDYDGNPTPIAVTVDQHLTMSPASILRMVFEADAWDSTISFAPGIPVALDGSLELTFADDVTLATQVGRTFHLFNWSGVSPTGAFTVSSPCVWDVSNLYTTGEVTLAAAPEPSARLILGVAVIVLLALRETSLPANGRRFHRWPERKSARAPRAGT